MIDILPWIRWWLISYRETLKRKHLNTQYQVACCWAAAALRSTVLYSDALMYWWWWRWASKRKRSFALKSSVTQQQEKIKQKWRYMKIIGCGWLKKKTHDPCSRGLDNVGIHQNMQDIGLIIFGGITTTGNVLWKLHKCNSFLWK